MPRAEPGYGIMNNRADRPHVTFARAATESSQQQGSEYRALAGLPGIDAARVWEPEPATVYFWER